MKIGRPSWGSHRLTFNVLLIGFTLEAHAAHTHSVYKGDEHTDENTSFAFRPVCDNSRPLSKKVIVIQHI